MVPPKKVCRHKIWAASRPNKFCASENQLLRTFRYKEEIGRHTGLAGTRWNRKAEVAVVRSPSKEGLQLHCWLRHAEEKEGPGCGGGGLAKAYVR